MDIKTQVVPGYYVWRIPEKPVAVHLHLDVIDRLSSEIMRGFGAVPKRGAEVGGVLIGTIHQDDDPAIVRVEDFELVECEYRRGPSYLLTGQDQAAFDDACARWQPSESDPAYAVGFFRSHTREGLSLSPEDLELMDRHFVSRSNIALLVKPYGARVSTASFFFREDGVFQESALLEFPFRRRELTGEDAPSGGRRSKHAYADPDPADELVPDPAPDSASARAHRGWVWIPMSFVFLLLGVLLGFLAALTMGPRAAGGSTQDFSLGLAVSKTDDNLSVKWDRQASAIRNSQRGVLEIEDGSYTKSVDLDTAQLQNGSIIYRNSSNTVRFRLVVYPSARLSLIETMEWKQ